MKARGKRQKQNNHQKRNKYRDRKMDWVVSKLTPEILHNVLIAWIITPQWGFIKSVMKLMLASDSFD